MITTTAPTIDATGIHIPPYADVLDFLKDKYRSIYGEDTYLEADSKDGQLLGVFAKAISDANSAAVSIYNSFSPGSAQGNALKSNVKINGIKANGATFSTVDVLIGGQVGTTITNGIVKDENDNQWALPATVTIPPSGEITVTATCTVLGATTAPAGSVDKIGTPTRGWQTVTNPANAAQGQPVETDPALRVRQKRSTALPSLTVLDGIVGAIADLVGVTRYAPYENDKKVTDSDGVPANSISMVVEGGDALQIASVIAKKKTPGTGTYGTTVESVTDSFGRLVDIEFFRPVDAPVTAAVTIKALTGYSSVVGDAINQAVSDYINEVVIGGGPPKCVEWDSSIAAAKSVAGSTTFKIVSLTLTGPRGAGAPDIALLFNEGASCTPGDVTLTVT